MRKTEFALALTLGHNSSAVLIQEGKILIGYENERISGVKSDSQFPSHAIREIGNYYDLNNVTEVHVSHWDIYGDVDNMSQKHWNRTYLKVLCPNAVIFAESDHHDCHVAASRAFSGPFEWEIVADGFGNFNEVMSVYKDDKLIHRVFGYEKSLGLLYQYTTAYLDMKMNQDEYKLLGYESKIDKVIGPESKAVLEASISKHAKKMFKSIVVPEIVPTYDAVASLDALTNIRLKISEYYDYLLFVKMGFRKSLMPLDLKKIVIAYHVQAVCEIVMSSIINYFCMDEVSLSGGLFMNVKLNNVMAKHVKRISVLPICGDQGAGIGAYNLVHGDLEWPGHLFWGIRASIPYTSVECLECFSIGRIHDAKSRILELLQDNKIVNVVHSNMEFGSRALGNTTTLAIPTVDNVHYINHLNNRNTIMPMAGMVAPEYLENYNGYDKVEESLKYMIITLDSKEGPTINTMGCHHFNPTTKLFTNRVQVVYDEHYLYDILQIFKILINTSFNIHGEPIVYSHMQARKSHSYQKDRDVENRVHTIIIN